MRRLQVLTSKSSHTIEGSADLIAQFLAQFLAQHKEHERMLPRVQSHRLLCNMPKMVPVGMPASIFLLPSSGSKTASYAACLHWREANDHIM